MKKFLKNLLILFVVLLIVLQFVPSNNNNNGSLINSNALEAVHQVPAPVSEILRTSCYDCHSNHTDYPWYSKIQPISWWLNDHIEEGKRELNFSEFGTYSLRRQYHKLEEITEQIEEKEMPLSSYTLIHQNANITEDQAKTMKNWVDNLRDSFRIVYPEDSLKRRRR